MAALFALRRRRLIRSIAVIGALLAAVATVPARAADTVAVLLDQAVITNLPERVATLVVGNPLIADVSMAPGGLLVITGKGYGTTNMIALDHSGAVLAERNIEVLGPRDNIVVVYRGANRESYRCKPDCEPRITLGDGTDYFNRTMQQAEARSSRAQAAGSSPGH